MQLRQLKTFVAVATTLNFTRAAEQVHLAQSSVTDQIQALEADLGTALFDRSRRTLKLTEAGQRLLDYATEILDLADEARIVVADAGGAPRGKLAIGGVETLCAEWLPELLAAFNRDYPTVDLVLHSAQSGQIHDELKSGVLDVGFLFGDLKAVPELRQEPVAQEELMFIVPPNHRYAGHPSVASDDLLDEPFLVTGKGCVYRRMFEAAFAGSLPVRPKIVSEVTSINAIRSLVKAGLGCALIPRVALPSAADDVIALPWQSADRETPITMAWRRRRVQSSALRSFLAAARDAFARSTADRRRHAELSR